ncbi:DUF3310 domain-containing protein [Pseudomonadota bacterium]
MKLRSGRRSEYEEKPDMVNHPPHHTAGGVEAIDVIRAKLTPEQFRGYLLGNILKYSMRCNHKGVFAQDVGKCQWYNDVLNELLDS